MTDAEDDYSSVDVAVTFMACVIMMLAVVKFTFAPEVPRADLPSAGQTAETTIAVPQAWSPAAPRTSFGWFDRGELVLVDMVALAASMADPAFAWPEAARLERPYPPGAPVPSGFVLTLSFAPDEFPQAWVRQRVVPGEDAPCAETETGRLTVWMPAEAEGSEPLIAWAARCGHRLRIEPLRKSDSGRLTPRLGVHPGVFSLSTIFR